MNSEPQQIDPNDPNTWPIVECESADVFVDPPTRTRENPHLTDEQKTWPIVECESADVFIDFGKQFPPRQSPQSQEPQA